MLATKSISTGGHRNIAIQNENGPCPLIAITNTLVLRDSPLAAFLSDKDQVSTADLTDRLADLADTKDMSALIEFLPTLNAGLDINPRFDGTFEPSRELKVFEAFDVPLVHGWVLGDLEKESLQISDATSLESARTQSYEQYAISRLENPDDPDTTLDKFVTAYPSQISASGLIHLHDVMVPGKPAILFCNNHFSTVILHNSTLYTLVTDEGYRKHPEIEWESLVNTIGAGEFVGSDFKTIEKIDTSRDEELAKQLQSEEQARADQANPGNRGASSERQNHRVEAVHVPPRRSSKQTMNNAPRTIAPKPLPAEPEPAPTTKKKKNSCIIS